MALSWLVLSFISLHNGTDLEWYLTSDYIGPREFVSFQLIHFFRSFSSDYRTKAAILAFAIGFFMSFGLVTIHKDLNGSRIPLYFIPIYLFIPPVFLSAEGMYRQGIGQIMLIFSLLFFCKFLRFRALFSLLASLCIFSIALFSHKSILFISPSVFIASIASLTPLFFRSLSRAFSNIFLKYRQFIFIIIFILFPLLIYIMFLLVGPLATFVFDTSTRQSSSGMTFLYFLPCFFQLYIALSDTVYFNRTIYMRSTLNSHTSDIQLLPYYFMSVLILFITLTSILIFHTPLFFQRTYYIALLFLPLQLTFTSQNFVRRNRIKIFTVICLLSFTLIFSPQYQFLLFGIPF